MSESDKKVLEAVRESLTCSICLNPLVMPVTLNVCTKDTHVCGHKFCTLCIRDYFEMNNPNKKYDNKCPVCRASVNDGGRIYKASDAYRQVHLIDTLNALFGKLPCPRCNEFKGFQEDLKNHLHNDCPESMTTCDDCLKMVKRGELQYHKNNECTYREVPCDKCGESIRVCVMEYHLRWDCSHRIVTCGCKERLEERFMPEHKTECSYHKSVKCDICDDWYREMYIESHIQKHPQCTYCSERVNSLQQHLDYHCDRYYLNCTKCNKKVLAKGFRKHEGECSIDPNEFGPQRLIKCKRCNFKCAPTEMSTHCNLYHNKQKRK